MSEITYPGGWCSPGEAFVPSATADAAYRAAYDLLMQQDPPRAIRGGIKFQPQPSLPDLVSEAFNRRVD